MTRDTPRPLTPGKSYAAVTRRVDTVPHACQVRDMAESNSDVDLRDALVGLLALTIADREERQGAGTPRRTELVLADAGLGVGTIAQLTGRKPDTVRKAIARARGAGGAS
jgi:DNA-directed RNA polymerase specialized sigma24 family protein